MSPFSLEGKNIFITGASSGIGRQIAISCSLIGARVILLGRNNERLQETLSHMPNPEKHLIYSVDLTDFDLVEEIIKDCVTKTGKIHGLVNCAGISTTLPVKYVTPEKLDEYFKTNVFGSYNITRLISKAGNFADGGSIIFFSSVMGVVGEVGKSLYSMTKGAVIAGVKSMALELATKKIRVNAISPGAIITPINENLPHISDPDKRKILEGMHPLGLGDTTDVANSVIFLLSDASRWITGTNLVIDGGYTAR